MKRNLESNLLTGYLPSFLSTEPSYSFKAADNEFYCPVPTWCDSYTTDGACAPCVPPISSSLLHSIHHSFSYYLTLHLILYPLPFLILFRLLNRI